MKANTWPQPHELERSPIDDAVVDISASIRSGTFADNFEALAEAAGGITQLRELAIELATKGLLLADTNRKDWRAVSLVDVAKDIQNGVSKRRGDAGSAVPVLRLADIDGGIRIKQAELREIVLTDAEQVKYRVHRGDVLVIRVNGSAGLVGRFIPCDVDRNWAYSDHLIRLRLNDDVDASFLSAVSRSAGARAHLATKTVTTAGQKTINQQGLGSLPLLLPPLAEQKRIVAKVDQLMALCDELEARQTKKRKIGTRLTMSALEALTSAKSPKEFDAAWKRVLENFDVLVDRAEKVAPLRRAILEMAVRAKLVPPSRSPLEVEALEAKILAERNLPIEGRGKGNRGKGKATAWEAPTPPYDLPASWRWRPLGEVAGHIVDGTHHTPKYVERGMDFISAKDIRNGMIRFEGCRQISRQEFEELTKRCRPKRGDVLVTKSGSIGEVSVVHTDAPFTLFESVALVPVVSAINSRYAAYVIYLGASGAFGAENKRGVGVPHLHLVDLRKLPFPLPPRGEQDAIVAKVEQLMKVCDKLDTHLRLAEDRVARLVAATVRELLP